MPLRVALWLGLKLMQSTLPSMFFQANGAACGIVLFLYIGHINCPPLGMIRVIALIGREANYAATINTDSTVFYCWFNFAFDIAIL